MERPPPTTNSDSRPVSRDSFYDASAYPTDSDTHPHMQLPSLRELDLAGRSNNLPPLTGSTEPASGTRLPSFSQAFAMPGPELSHIPSFHDIVNGHSTSSSRSYRQTPLDSDTSILGTPMASSGSKRNSLHDEDNIKLVAQALADLKATPSPQVAAAEPASKRPLLDVITSSHPLIASTVNRTNQAYNSSKNFSPRFKSTAEYMERSLQPLANTAQNVGRVTGVESSLRWILGDRGQRQPALVTSSVQEASSSKRRKVNDGASVAASEDGDYHERRMSMVSNGTTSGFIFEDGKPPSYVATSQHPSPDVHYSQPHNREQPKNMTMRFIRSTAGLSSALNQQSMHSMKYCLAMMRRANKNIEDHVSSLTNLIEEYDRAEARELEAKKNAEGDSERRDSIDDVDMQSVPPGPSTQPNTPTAAVLSDSLSTPRTRREVSERVQRLKSEVASVLNDTMNKISLYAGNVLPPGARDIVRRSLVSLPGRAIGAHKQQAAAEQEAIRRGELPSHRSRTRRNAQTAITLAKEGLKMLLQISSVLDSTIGSAEEWCDRLGKEKGNGRLVVGLGVGSVSSRGPSVAGSVNEDAVMKEDIRPPTTAEKRPLEA